MSIFGEIQMVMTKEEKVQIVNEINAKMSEVKEDANSYVELANAYNMLGLAFCSEENYKEAQECFSNSFLTTDHIIANGLPAKTTTSYEELDRKLADAKNALETNENDDKKARLLVNLANAYNNMALYFHSKGNRTDALSFFSASYVVARLAC